MYGDIKITLVKTETLAEYVVRTFALERVSLLSPGDLGCLRGWGRAHMPTSPSPGAGGEEGTAGLPLGIHLVTAGSGVIGREANCFCWRLQKEVQILQTMTVVAGCGSYSVPDAAECVTHTVSALEGPVG